MKRDYTHGELTAAEWRELRADLAPELDAARAEAERLRERLRAVASDPAITDVEAELLEQLEWRRSARLFDGFVLHRGTPDHAHVELIGECWIEPIISLRAVEGYDEKLRPVLTRKPLEQAENNYADALLL